MFVYEEEGRLAGLIRVERDSVRDEWTIVELDGIGSRPGRRHPLPARPAGPPRGREARRRGGSTSPAPTRTATSSCSCRPGFARYGEERILYRAGRPGRCPSRGPDEQARDCRIRPASPLDALAAARGCTRPATPQPVQRLEALRLPDWERQGTNWRVPRSSLAPILRFADVEAFVQESADGGKDGTQLDGFVQIGVAKEDQPHYLKLLGRPDVDVADSRRRSPSGAIAARTDEGRRLTAASTASSPRSGPTSRRSIGGSRTRASVRSPL